MKQALVNRTWSLMLPDQIADWDAITGWELKRFASMQRHLERGMVLFDIGAEHGWISAILAGWVGGENMVLVEPSPEFWRNIRLTWEANGLVRPRLMAQAFCGSEGIATGASQWPDCAAGDDEVPAMPYRYLHEPKHRLETPCTTIDVLAGQVPPAAITIDVEGAELTVLRGAVATLLTVRPLVWVSIHPDLMERDYGATPRELRAFMADQGYGGECLGIDHEEHWLFRPA